MIIEPVVAQHTEEAAFLWLLRDAAVGAPHYLLWELAKLDNRVEAHLDGLRIAGDDGWVICAEAAAAGPGEVFAAAVLAFESGRDERIQLVLKAGTAKPEPARGLVTALGWLPLDLAEKHARALLASPEAAQRRVGIAALAAHRQPPGRALDEAIADQDLPLRARALRAVGELGLVNALPLVRRHLKAEDQGCPFAAAWSAALLDGDPAAVATLRDLADSASPLRERALQMALRRLELRVAKQWQQKLAQKPALLRQAVIAVSAIGDPELLPWLIEQMKVPPLARVAGEAFSMITGVDIAFADLDDDKPEDFEAGPTEDPADPNVAMDPDENLPWPNRSLIQGWWNKHQSEFPPGTRHLLGQRITPEWLMEVLRTGRQRQRAAAALELAIRQPGQPLFEVRAPGFRQQQMLALKPA